MMKGPNSCCLTSCLCDGLVGGGLHRHSRGCSIADGGGGEISKTCFSSHSLTTRTAPIAKRILDDSLEKGGVGEQVSQPVIRQLTHTTRSDWASVHTDMAVIMTSLHLRQSHSMFTHLCHRLRGSGKRRSRDDTNRSSPVSRCF